jgi:hypothetical protein
MTVFVTSALAIADAGNLPEYYNLNISKSSIFVSIAFKITIDFDYLHNLIIEKK